MSSKDTKRLKPFLWFTLYQLLKLGATNGYVKISTSGLARKIGNSQQSTSRHLTLLEQKGLIMRRFEVDGSLIKITKDGLNSITEVYANLKIYMEDQKEETYSFIGTVFSGISQGAYYINQNFYKNQIKKKVGFYPYPGTLNLRIMGDDLEKRRKLDKIPYITINGFRNVNRAFGGGRCYPLMINNEVEGALIIADRTRYDTSVLEVISPINLRERFDLKDGDKVRVSISSPLRSSF